MPAYKYTLKDGKTTLWYANFYYTDWTGKRLHICKRGFKTQRDAKEYEHMYLDRQTRTSDILFASLVDEYMADMSHRLKPTTMSGKEYLISTKLLPYFGRTKVCDIDPLKIRKWQNELLDHRDQSGKPYSNTYLKTIHNQMSAIMNYAVSHYGLRVNPCHVSGSIGKSKAGEMKFWTPEEYEIFSSFVKKTIYKLAFDTLFYTGMRSGELLALTPADILPDKKISICKNFARKDGLDLLLTPKTQKSIRTISIPDFLYDELNDYITKVYLPENERIFYFTKSGLGKFFADVTKKAGLEQIRVHDLRHSHVSMLINMGFDIKEISERLGHESVKTTWDTYAHLYPDQDKKMANELNKLRRPSE